MVSASHCGGSVRAAEPVTMPSARGRGDSRSTIIRRLKRHSDASDRHSEIRPHPGRTFPASQFTVSGRAESRRRWLSASETMCTN